MPTASLAKTKSFSRRAFLGGGAAVAGLAMVGRAQAQTSLRASDYGVVADSAADQTAALAAAMREAAQAGAALQLPAGTVFADGLAAPRGLSLIGVPGLTRLAARTPGPILRCLELSGARLTDITFASAQIDARDSRAGLVTIEGCDDVSISGCRFVGGPANGLTLIESAAIIENCRFADQRHTAIFSLDSRGLFIRGNRIEGPGNSGIRLWRTRQEPDGSIVSGNTITRVDWRDGGNGQNGNGINVFRAGQVIIADNRMSDCAFSAIRLNAADNCIVQGNVCVQSGETALYSEFGFSGSVIADNIVDGAGTGISITNFNAGGRLATCSGNIVRNVFPSVVNPDDTQVGIYVEADTAVTGNLIEAVPGLGILAGYGPYLRDVLIANNVVRACRGGIGVSVAPNAGPARVAGNLISGAQEAALVGLRWNEVASRDLAADRGRYPHLSVEGNLVA